MKNWNDAGTVHYDSSTNQHIRRIDLSFEVMGKTIHMPLLIPETIKRSLRSHHFDAAVIRSRQIMKEQMAATIAAGWWWNDYWFKRAMKVTTKAVCELLYAEFMHEQARAGNQVWQVPETMVEVGPPPEEDKL